MKRFPTIEGRYKIEQVTDHPHMYRIMELKPRKGNRGGPRYECVAIGVGKTNMDRLARKLKR